MDCLDLISVLLLVSSVISAIIFVLLVVLSVKLRSLEIGVLKKY